MHTQLFRRTRLRPCLLALLTVITLAIPVLSGTGLSAFDTTPLVAQAANIYENLSLDFAMSTAFQDAQNSLDKGDLSDEATYWNNIRDLTANGHFGNVGLLLGPKSKGDSKQSDLIGALLSPLAMDSSTIQLYDSHTDGNNSFSKYQAFGTAVQNLNQKALKTRGASSSLEDALNEMSAAAGKITGMGTTILKDYNPAPLIMAMVDANELSIHPENKLVALVNNNTQLQSVFMTLGGPTSFGIPLYFLIMAILALLLLLFSALLMLINGQSGGQGIRKAVVRAMIGCVAVPLLARGLDAGINFLDTMALTVAESPDMNYVKQNLNMLDWAKCGFVIPEGRTITIDEKGRFLFTPDDVLAINQKVAELTGEPTDAASMKQVMERYYTAQKVAYGNNGLSPSVALTKPNRMSDGTPWRTKNYYVAVSNLAEGKPLNEGMSGEPSEPLGKVGYLAYNGLRMEQSGSGYVVTGQHSYFGISPIAATNLLRTTFDGTGMQITGGNGLGSVAMDVDNYTSAGSARMGGLVRMIAMFSMMIAAIKGMFTIFGAGFGGIFSGGAKAALGSSSGVGQAVGGIVAIVGGLFGIGLIMTATYGLLDQFYVLINDLIDGVGMDSSLLEPIRDAVFSNRLTDFLFGRMLTSFGNMICTVLCIIILPKFGGIPVTLFCQHLADLPNVFASRAQLLENRITGDYHSGVGGRGGGGGVGSGGNMVNQAVQKGISQGKQAFGGAKMAAAALGGYGLSKLGQHLENKGDSSLAAANEAANETPENGLGTEPSGTTDGAPDTTSQDPSLSGTGDATQNNQVDGPHTNTTNNEGGTTLAETETKDEQHSDSSVESLSDSIQEQISDQAGGETLNLSETSTESLSDSIQENTSSLSQSDATSHTMDGDGAAGNGTDRLKEGSSGASPVGKGTSASGATSMASGARTTSQQATRDTNVQRAARQAGTTRSTGTQRPDHAVNTPQRELTKDQKKANRTRAIGRALQVAGGRTTGRQAIAGVAAGMTHTVASVHGVGNVTQSAVHAVQNSKDRARDRQEGLPPGTTANQRAARRAATNNQVSTTETTNQSAPRQDGRSYETFLADEAMRQSER